jgi:hypothetical protein
MSIDYHNIVLAADEAVKQMKVNNLKFNVAIFRASAMYGIPPDLIRPILTSRAQSKNKHREITAHSNDFGRCVE